MKEEYAPAMLQANMTVGYQLSRSFSLQGGVNNLFNQVNARYMSNIPGINWFTGLHYSFKK